MHLKVHLFGKYNLELRVYVYMYRNFAESSKTLAILIKTLRGVIDKQNESISREFFLSNKLCLLPG